jgi:hypothetical protein
MFGPKIRIPVSLYEKLRRVADAEGYSSVRELIIHVLEQTATRQRQPVAEDEVRKRLRGLGYLE